MRAPVAPLLRTVERNEVFFSAAGSATKHRAFACKHTLLARSVLAQVPVSISHRRAERVNILRLIHAFHRFAHFTLRFVALFVNGNVRCWPHRAYDNGTIACSIQSSFENSIPSERSSRVFRIFSFLDTRLWTLVRSLCVSRDR